jgi:hypothetical protein
MKLICSILIMTSSASFPGLSFANTPESCFTIFGSGISSYECSDTNVVIPAIIDGITIGQINTGAFSFTKLISVRIPTGSTYLFEIQLA